MNRPARIARTGLPRRVGVEVSLEAGVKDPCAMLAAVSRRTGYWTVRSPGVDARRADRDGVEPPVARAVPQRRIRQRVVQQRAVRQQAARLPGTWPSSE